MILLNTCSVRDKAEQKVYSALGQMEGIQRPPRRRHHRRRRLRRAAGGRESATNALPHLDLVFGTHNIHKLPEMVEQVQASPSRPVETAFYRDPAYMEDPDEPNTQVRRRQSLRYNHAGMQ